ncbi:MAG: DUF4392 domain-containing protein [Candidatus Caldarchaeum sp.]
MDVSEYVDRVVSVDYNARGVVEYLYTAARKRFGRPLCAAAAERINDADSLLIITGFRVLRFGGRMETDGLVSASLLAACMEAFYGKKVSVVVDRGFEDVAAYGLRAAGAKFSNVYGLPQTAEDCETVLAKIFENTNPDAVVFIERPGANKLGVYHNAVGMNITSLHAPVDMLVSRLIRRSTVVAYGDGGNEVGMGAVMDAVEKKVPYGAVCRCGCGGGIAASMSSDILVVSSVSDFGVFGTLALLGKPVLNHVLDKVGDVINTLIAAGCVDALKGPGYNGVDGVDVSSTVSVVQLLSKASRSGVRRL